MSKSRSANIFYCLQLFTSIEQYKSINKTILILVNERSVSYSTWFPEQYSEKNSVFTLSRFILFSFHLTSVSLSRLTFSQTVTKRHARQTMIKSSFMFSSCLTYFWWSMLDYILFNPPCPYYSSKQQRQHFVWPNSFAWPRTRQSLLREYLYLLCHCLLLHLCNHLLFVFPFFGQPALGDHIALKQYLLSPSSWK